ncbi:MAG: anaerobic glycerol-3-phosphate dehydrogenase subunit A [Methanomassiliicoccus sp.]|nr:anaerobic glycerol-3-phosphate dehydrogenase subunit A [Methanomassiliicoccus sp.]
MRRVRRPAPEVLIIGGGVTGTGIARDMAMRGVEVLLVEAGDLCAGASGGNHGMLHSGGRYAVRDSQAAAECAAEGAVLKRIARYCIEDCGGLFVSLPPDDPEYIGAFLTACRGAGVWTEEITAEEAFRDEPNLSREVRWAVRVADASIDPFFLAWGNVESAREAGAEIHTHLPLRSLKVREGRIAEAVLGIGNRTVAVRPEMVINATGAWCGRTAAMAGVRIDMQLDKGSMIVFNGRTVNGLVNRLRSPSDGDIMVPHRSSTILGTTSGPGDLDDVRATRAEVERLTREATAVSPGMATARMVRAYAGVRPLLSTGGVGRQASRGFSIIDHSEDGVDNLVSVVGGKLTTYRLMAEKASDVAMSKLGKRESCRTMLEEILPPIKDSSTFLRSMMASKYGGLADAIWSFCQRTPLGMDEVCSCEGVSRGELEYFASSPDVRSPADLMRRTRAGMGFCQGGLCAFRLAGALEEGDPAEGALAFMDERWKGVDPVLQGEQLRQEVFRAHLLRCYGIDHTKGGQR